MIPDDIEIDRLRISVRGISPSQCYVEDQIYWNNAETHFVFIYTIYEASMNNDVGHIAWGMKTNDGIKILEKPDDYAVCCWGTPYCKWLNDNMFIFKVQKYSKRLNRMYTPLVSIDIHNGFNIIENSNNTDSRVSKYNPQSLSFTNYTSKILIEAIESLPYNKTSTKPLRTNANKTKHSRFMERIAFIYLAIKPLGPSKEQEQKANRLVNKAGFALIFIVVIYAVIKKITS